MAKFYTVTEAMSVVENAAALGVPLTPQLVQALAKLKKGQKGKLNQKMPQAPQSKIS